MKRWMIYSILLLWACGEDSEDFGAPDQLLLLSDREVICPGQTATFRLFSTSSGKEVPISEFIFDPLPNEIGTISSVGLLSVGPANSNSELTISGTYKSTTKLSTKIKVQVPSESPVTSLGITPFGFYHPDEGRPFYFWPDGSVILGSRKFGPESLKQFELSKYSEVGVLQWKKELGSGEAKFIQVINDQIYAAGILLEIGGAVSTIIIIYDLDGNVVWEKKMASTSQHVFWGFQVDSSGNFYLSTYSTGSSFVTSLSKFNSLGEKVWEIDPKISYREILIFQDGNIVAKSEEGLGGEPFLTFFNSSGELLKKERTEFAGVNFKGPNDTFGVGYEVPSGGSSAIYFDLFNSIGQKIESRKQLVAKSYAGSLTNPTEKKTAPAGFTKFLASENGEIHVMNAGFWGNYDFLILNSSSGKEWVWWKENKERTAEGVLYPLQIIENENKLILFTQSDGKLNRFTLGKDYSFDDCLREPYWNKLEMF
jgi:hypothetical protein